MKIFVVNCDVNHFQAFMLADDALAGDDRYNLCKRSPRAADWDPPEVYLDPPLAKRGDFATLWGCFAFAMAPRAYEVLNDILVPAGELLPLPHEGTQYKVFHVLKLSNCFDSKRSAECGSWELDRPKPRLYFKPKLVPKASVFKFRGDAVRYYAVERTGDPKTEFKAAVEHHGLTGLIFKKIWEG